MVVMTVVAVGDDANLLAARRSFVVDESFDSPAEAAGIVGVDGLEN
jgi:hypothetical protein